MKHGYGRIVSRIFESHPSRVRGLKRLCWTRIWDKAPVAPFTGAWVETPATAPKNSYRNVAPFTGAWVET